MGIVMLAARTDIERFIPQREPMVMIHELHEADEQHAVTTLLIEQNNTFLDSGKLAEPGLIENIAQTAAAQVGYVCAQLNKPVPIGYIAAIKDLVIHGLPELNTQIRTVVEVVNVVMDITLIRGTVHQNNQLLCECEMRIFVKNLS
ncbi:MAG TPA: 3-hydroxyacyl-ACP dehydratase [Cyclobacteriaceae bacterium]|nr:3-hydroxyacyl-ACP dehydratase [Cyclobacteriaceae bacterium]